MLRPSILNIVLFWFVKYILFYLFLMLKNDNYAFIKFNELETSEDWYYYLWLFLFMPVLCSVLLTAPVYFSFKVKTTTAQILILLAVFVIEYLLYTYLASPANFWNGVYSAILGVIIFAFFFYKYLPSFGK